MHKTKRIRDILTRSKSAIEIQDGVSYKQVTIRTNYKGVLLRGIQDGQTIGTKNQFLVAAGQFILSRIDARNGAFGIVPEELEGAIVTNDFLAFDINEEEVEREFFNAFLQSPLFLEACIKASRGNTNRKRVDESFFLNYEVDLPDLADQKRLIKQINQARTSLQIAQNEISHQENILAKFKQAVLRDAIEGRLTFKWRQENSETEPAKLLLSRIKEKRATLIAERKVRFEKPLSPLTTNEIPFEIPNEWAWCRFGDLIQAYEAGSSFKCSDREVLGLEWGVIKTSAITSGEFIERENKFYSSSAPTDVSAQVLVGDLIFCRASGSKGLAGKCAIVRSCARNLLLSDKTIRIRLMEVNPDYIALHNDSDQSRFYLSGLSTNKSTSMNNVTRDALFMKPVPLPPLEEQTAIVENIKALMKIYDVLQTEIERSRKCAADLLQAVMKAAFSRSYREKLHDELMQKSNFINATPIGIDISLIAKEVI